MADKQKLPQVPEKPSTEAKIKETPQKAPLPSNAKASPKASTKPRAKPPAKPKTTKVPSASTPEAALKTEAAPKAVIAPKVESAPVPEAVSQPLPMPKKPAPRAKPPAKPKTAKAPSASMPEVALKTEAVAKAETAPSVEAAPKAVTAPTVESAPVPEAVSQPLPVPKKPAPRAKPPAKPKTAKAPSASMPEVALKTEAVAKTETAPSAEAAPKAVTAPKVEAAPVPEAVSQPLPVPKKPIPRAPASKPPAKAKPPAKSAAKSTTPVAVASPKPEAPPAKSAAKPAKPTAKAAAKPAPKAAGKQAPPAAAEAAKPLAPSLSVDNAPKTSVAQNPKKAPQSSPKARSQQIPRADAQPKDSAAAKAAPPKHKAAPPAPKKPSQPNPALLAVGSWLKKIWPHILHPIVALVGICLVTSLLLGVTNEVTKPLIEANAKAAADAARSVLLPEADGFEEIFFPEDFKGITSIYQAKNQMGYVIESYAKGYNGKVSVMVGFNAENTITGVHFMPNNETPGLGKKLNTDPKFAAQFANRRLQRFELSQKELDGGIVKIASATISTGGAIDAVNCAVDFYNEKVLGEDPRPSTPEEVNPTLLPGATSFTQLNLSVDNVFDAYRADNGSFIIYTTAPGYVYAETKDDDTLIKAAVAMDKDGTILAMWLSTSEETPGKGTPLQDDTEYIAQFTGKTPSDVFAQQGSTPPRVESGIIAGATVTSDAVAEAVATALNALSAAKEAS